MSLRLDHDYPDRMSPADRRDEVASILARGIMRLHGRVVGDFGEPQDLAEDASTCLDLPSGLRPDRPAG